MSWDIFRDNMESFYNSIDSVDGIISKKLAIEYDLCVKRGGDTINGMSIKSGNLDLLERSFEFAFQIGNRTIGPYDIIGGLGRGIVSYWVGAQMNIIATPPKSPIPSIPAVGSIQNVAVLSNVIFNPGVFPPSSPLPPSNSPDLFLSTFINLSKIHLSTISGIMFTISLYPPLSTPSLGIINWNGYTS